MNIWIVLLILLLLFGVPGAWHYGGTGGPYLGGGLGLVILIIILVMVFGR